MGPRILDEKLNGPEVRTARSGPRGVSIDVAGSAQERSGRGDRGPVIGGGDAAVLGDRLGRGAWGRGDVEAVVGGGDAAVLGDRLGRGAWGRGDVEAVVGGGDAAVLDHRAGVVVDHVGTVALNGGDRQAG